MRVDSPPRCKSRTDPRRTSGRRWRERWQKCQPSQNERAGLSPPQEMIEADFRHKPTVRDVLRCVWRTASAEHMSANRGLVHGALDLPSVCPASAVARQIRLERSGLIVIKAGREHARISSVRYSSVRLRAAVIGSCGWSTANTSTLATVGTGGAWGWTIRNVMGTRVCIEDPFGSDLEGLFFWTISTRLKVY